MKSKSYLTAVMELPVSAVSALVLRSASRSKTYREVPLVLKQHQPLLFYFYSIKCKTVGIRKIKITPILHNLLAYVVTYALSFVVILL